MLQYFFSLNFPHTNVKANKHLFQVMKCKYLYIQEKNVVSKDFFEKFSLMKFLCFFFIYKYTLKSTKCGNIYFEGKKNINCEKRKFE